MKPMKVFPDFATFFREIWGYDPFPWQSRLAAITNEGVWPEWITLPTGTGKTTAIDIAIYNLALFLQSTVALSSMKLTNAPSSSPIA
jgi:hypothetical protein